MNKKNTKNEEILVDFSQDTGVEGLGEFKVQHIESIFDEEDFLAYATYRVKRKVT